MNRVMLFVLIALFCVPVIVLAQAPAQTPAAAAPAAAIQPVKIAWINPEQVIFTCDEGKIRFGEIQKYVEDKNTELDGKRKELEKLRNNLSVQGSKLTDEARDELARQIDEKQTAIQRFQEDTQKQIEARRNSATNYVGKRMQAAIEKVAKDKGLDAILYLSQDRDAWVDTKLILSEEVVKIYNQLHPVAGAAKAAPAAAAPKQ